MPKTNRKSTSSSTGPLLMISAGIIIIVVLLLVQVLNSQTGAANIGKTTLVGRVSLTDGKQAFDSNNATFVDVRDPDAYAAGHIPGAVNIPLDELDNRSRELNPNQWIITYCT